MIKQPFTLDRTVRTVGGILIIAGIILLLKRLSGVLLPFFAAWLLAYMLNPFVHFFQNKLKVKKRGLAVALVFITIFSCLFGAIYFAAANITNEIVEMKKLTSHYFAMEHNSNLPPLVANFFKDTFSHVEFDQWLDMDKMIATIKSVVPKAFDMVSASFQYLTSLVVLFIFCLYLFFLAMDYDKLSETWHNYIPKKYRSFTITVVDDLTQKMNTYFRKQALISFILGILFAIGFSILQLPMAITMGLLVGVLNMVPYMHSLGIIPPLCVALMQSAIGGPDFWWTALFILIVFGVNQLILDAFLTPKIMGNATGLHPAIILLSLSIWGSLMGVVGIIIALPVTTIIVTYYQYFIIDQKSIPTDTDVAQHES
jgi:predicted PurR-regulated permease PerM